MEYAKILDMIALRYNTVLLSKLGSKMCAS